MNKIIMYTFYAIVSLLGSGIIGILFFIFLGISLASCNYSDELFNSLLEICKYSSGALSVVLFITFFIEIKISFEQELNNKGGNNGNRNYNNKTSQRNNKH